MFDFVTQLDDFFLALYVHLTSNLRDESITAAVLLAIFVVILLLHKRATGLLSRTDWKFKSYARFLSGILFPLIYLLIVRSAGGYLKGEFAFILFNSLAYFYLGFHLIKYLLEPLKISYIPWNVISYFLLLVAAIFVMLMNLNSHFLITLIYKKPSPLFTKSRQFFLFTYSC